MEEKNIYTCSFCEKKEEGKPLEYLTYNTRFYHNGKPRPIPLNGTSVALMPYGWDWDIQPISFRDLWSCGCHKLR